MILCAHANISPISSKENPSISVTHESSSLISLGNAERHNQGAVHVMDILCCNVFVSIPEANRKT